MSQWLEFSGSSPVPGAIAAMTLTNLGPNSYPIALAVTRSPVSARRRARYAIRIDLADAVDAMMEYGCHARKRTLEKTASHQPTSVGS
jgi:hypothetical protein